VLRILARPRQEKLHLGLMQEPLAVAPRDMVQGVALTAGGVKV